MTSEKVLQVIETYRQLFIKRCIGKIEYLHDELVKPREPDLEHCHYMLDKMVEFVRKGRMEKVFRWLGFIQGVLWIKGIYTIDQLMNHSRPDPKEQ